MVPAPQRPGTRDERLGNGMESDHLHEILDGVKDLRAAGPDESSGVYLGLKVPGAEGGNRGAEGAGAS